MVEEIAAGDGSVSTLVSVHNAPTCEILQMYGTDAQRERGCVRWRPAPRSGPSR